MMAAWGLRHMAEVQVRDYALWIGHIHGDDDLKRRLAHMEAGETVWLSVAGKVGRWLKMADGADGRPTPGLKPGPEVQEMWRGPYRERRGELVALADAAPPTAPPPRRPGLAMRLMRLGARYAGLPDADTRTADEILGYGPDGAPR
jgi:hypothetical protein